MDLIADILLISGAVAAAFYCTVLSRRLRRFKDLDNGMGGAIAVLSAQVDDMTRALAKAQGSATESSSSLEGLTVRAEEVARRLELLVASMHDLPPPATANAPARAQATPPPTEPPRTPAASATSQPAQAPATGAEPVSLFRSARNFGRGAAA